MASFAVGDVVLTRWRPDRPTKVTATMYEAVVRMRSALIVTAQRRTTLSYQELSTAIDSLYPRQGLGRPLDLLSEDCARRGEPSLAALVVKNSTGKVGSAFIGDDGSSREDCYRQWSAVR